MMRFAQTLSILLLIYSIGHQVSGQTETPVPDTPVADTSVGDRMIDDYFRRETKRIADASLSEYRTLDEWLAVRGKLRSQLAEMLGVPNPPVRSDLQVEITGRLEHDQFYVENLSFQSLPGLYVTANLYVPKEVDAPLPAVLYVCGHGGVKVNGVSHGNKTNYQHHGEWFARQGYVCLTIDTLQLGEIEGIHHGTYRYDRWWWLNRGYTPAGVEAWNGMRAIDYLQSRPEVDDERIGVTGRSGGGAYSWWLAALDERVKCAVPVAGITDLQNHVVDGTVEGHCDCMFFVNTYEWDYPAVAALVAPRPLLISNSDRDRIFPLDGVMRTYTKVRDIYRLYGAEEDLALNITAGPHKDTQELRVHAFRWFNKYLRNDESLIESAAVKFFETEQLKVFDELPPEQANTTIDETFIPAFESPTPVTERKEFDRLQEGWMSRLRNESFRGWPDAEPSLNLSTVYDDQANGLRLRAFDFLSQPAVELRLYVLERAQLKSPELTVLHAMDEEAYSEFAMTMRSAFPDRFRHNQEAADDLAAGEQAFEQMQRMLVSSRWVMAFVAPRGVGDTVWDPSPKKRVQIRRRFYLLGQSLDGMRVWDVKRAIQATRSVSGLEDVDLWLQAEREMAGVALYAALFEPPVARLDLYGLSATHRDGPYLFNVSKFLDLPQTVAMVAARSRVVLYGQDAEDWSYPTETANNLGWQPRQIQFREVP